MGDKRGTMWVRWGGVSCITAARWSEIRFLTLLLKSHFVKVNHPDRPPAARSSQCLFWFNSLFCLVFPLTAQWAVCAGRSLISAWEGAGLKATRLYNSLPSGSLRPCDDSLTLYISSRSFLSVRTLTRGEATPANLPRTKILCKTNDQSGDFHLSNESNLQTLNQNLKAFYPLNMILPQRALFTVFNDPRYELGWVYAPRNDITSPQHETVHPWRPKVYQ